MSDFYTDVDIFKNKILLRGYEAGKRIQKEIDYQPYLFIPSKNNVTTEYTNVRGQHLHKMNFDSIYDAKDFMKRYKEVSNFKIYGMDRFVYPFISDNYQHTVKYDVNQIKVMYLDIEVDSTDGFPDIELANRHITAITYRIGHERVVMGLKDFDVEKLARVSDKQNIKYFKFKDEESLLRNFIRLWDSEDIDVVTGWNIELFDIPYIIRRLRVVLGTDEANRISPWRRLIERKIEIRGKENTVFYPTGIAVLDYIQLYKKFTYSQRESYSLNYISHVELGVEKMDYSDYENLQDLYNKNHQLFIEYNIIDVDLVYQLEDKLRLIELVFAIAYDAKVNYTDALGSVLLWDVLIMNYLMNKKIVVEPQVKKSNRPFEGAYVKDPQLGMHEWVVSFDLTSLYPHLIMQYNISPETYVTRLSNDITVDALLDNYVNETNYTLAANGCQYTREKYGFLPSLMELQFKLREEYKAKMKEAKKKLVETKDLALEKEVARYNNAQMAKKIQLNSAYGAVANEYFRWYDPAHAEAITLSGQLSIRWIAKAVNDYLNKIMKTDNDYILAIDTDSIYVNFGPLVKQLQPKNPIDFLDKLAKEKIEPFMTKKYDELAVNMNAYANKMFMKREAIADKAIWRAKKNYIAHVWDNEGVRYKEPELKLMGIEAVRSSTPEICRKKIKEVIKLIVTTDEETVRNFVEQFRKQYTNLPFEDLAFPRSVKKLSKYHDAAKIYALGTPVHAKGSLIYNNLLRKYKLTKKYSLVYDMDKIKWAYLKIPNPTHEEVIASPSILPKEFELEKYIDYDLMFSKSFLEPVKSITDVIGWELEKTSTLEDFFS